MTAPVVSDTVERRVAVVEDHQLLAEALDIALTAQGYDIRRIPIPEIGSAPAALVTAIVRIRPRVVLLDLDLGGFGDGTRLIEPLTRTGTKVVVMTGSNDRARWGAAIRMGARKVVAKTRPLADITSVVRRVNQGLAVMDTTERDTLLAAWQARAIETRELHSRLEHLTPREAEVLGHLMRGHTVRDIATISVVSEATVRTQVKSILAKLGVSSQLAAVGIAHRVGWRVP